MGLRFVCQTLGGRVNLQTNYGLTALMISCCRQRRTRGASVGFLELIGDRRVSTEGGEGDGEKENTFFPDALVNVVGSGSEEREKELSTALSPPGLGADPLLTTDVGFDALAFASDYGNYHLVDRLLQWRGAGEGVNQQKVDPNLRFFGRSNRTALHCASALGHLEV